MTVTTFTAKDPDTGVVWDLRDIVSDIKWVTSTDYAAGELTFKTVEVDEDYTPKNGSVVSFKWDKQPVFKGRIFKTSYSDDETFSVTAYDSLRYFKNQDSLVWPVSTLTQRFTKVAKLAGVKYKVVSKSTHKLKAEVADSKSYFDMLKSSISAVKSATDHQYYLFDNYGVVELRRMPHKALKTIIGDKSEMTGFTYERSIEDTANVIRVIRSDKKKKQSTSSTAKAKAKKETEAEKVKNTKITAVQVSGGSVARWGKLQYIEKAKDKANKAQMKQRAKELLKSKNKQKYTLTLKAIGNLDLVAGNSVYEKVKSLKQVGLGTKQLLITKATHNFDLAYTVDLETKVKI